MAEPTQRWPIRNAWVNFVKSVQMLLVPQPDDRPLDQYLAFRDAVISLVQNEHFLAELNDSWPVYTDYPKDEIGKALLLELEAFPRAVEVAKAVEKPEGGKGWWHTMLGRASTVSGSVKDVMDDLPPTVKSGVTLFKEVIDLFKGKD